MKNSLIRGLKWGGISVIGLWLFVLAAVVLSYFGLVLLMIAANLMSAAAETWFALFTGSSRRWWEIFGFAVEFLAPGLVLISLFLTTVGVLVSAGLSLFQKHD
jgi:hypothetical protein